MRHSVWKLVEERTKNSVQIWRQVKEPSEANWTNNKWAAGGERCLWELHKSNGDRGNCWIKSRHCSRGGKLKMETDQNGSSFHFEWRGLKVSALGAAKENAPTEGVCVPLISPQAIVALADSKKCLSAIFKGPRGVPNQVSILCALNLLAESEAPSWKIIKDKLHTDSFWQGIQMVN